MQMSHLYESTNRKLRASKMRTDARDCERRGFPGIASVLWESAEWIDPTPREKPEHGAYSRQRRREPQQSPQQRSTPAIPVNRAKVLRQTSTPVVEYRRPANGNVPKRAA